MAEFDDKLNSLLSNPEAMDQIMKMAQSLMDQKIKYHLQCVITKLI